MLRTPAGSSIGRLIVLLLVYISVESQLTADDRLVGHWPLESDAEDVSGHGHHGAIHGGLSFQSDGAASGSKAAHFNGRDSWIELPAGLKATLGDELTVSMRVQVSGRRRDVAGDLFSAYAPSNRRGLHLTIKDNAVTTSHSNFGQLSFGADNQLVSSWADCGRPGNALLVFGMTVFQGALYAGTCEPGAGDRGRVYRYAPSAGGTAVGSSGSGEWVDVGAPDGSNSVTALAVYNGQLYAGTGKYRVAGSALPESENKALGGRVFRYEADNVWVDCGQLPDAEAVGGMIVFNGQLYASSLYKPAGFFRYEGNSEWTRIPTPGDKRTVALGVFNDHLYATSYDGGVVFRFDGSTWEDCGQLGDNTQTYSFTVYQGKLFVGTWPSGRVYQFVAPGNWQDTGRLGEELEVMGMLVHNGRFIAGTLPLAEVYSFDGMNSWNKLTRLDLTPDVKYRRAWTMAEVDGRVFCSTLPSGKVYSFSAGTSAQSGTALSDDWHHVAAVYSKGSLKLFVDGRLQAVSQDDRLSDLKQIADGVLKIGFGENDYFNGQMRDVRLHRAPLSESEIQSLAGSR